MSARANLTSPTETQLRAQPFTPALPSEDSHSATGDALHASWEMLLRARRPEDITAARTAVSDNLDCLALHSRRSGGDQVLPAESINFPDSVEEQHPQGDSQGSIPAALLTALEHLPRVGSPEGISGARIAAVAGLAHLHTGRSIAGLGQVLQAHSTYVPDNSEMQAPHRRPGLTHVVPCLSVQQLQQPRKAYLPR